MKNWLKQNWKIILIVILAFLFMTKCSSSGNYKRAYNAQLQRTEYVKDSLMNMYSNSAHHIDSLNSIIKDLTRENYYQEDKINNLNAQVKDLNNQLFAALNKENKVTVEITQKDTLVTN